MSMTTNKQALGIPQRESHNWGQSVMHHCDFCGQFHPTVTTKDGEHICASCCDAEYVTVLTCALEVAIERVEAAERRNAELEAREVREDGNQFLVVRHPGKVPVIKHCAGDDLEGFLRQLLEHDPMVTIDIVTHRYYGVGGQWVQDADEYLRIAAATDNGE